MAATQPGLKDKTTIGEGYDVNGKSAIVTGAGSGMLESLSLLPISIYSGPST